MSMNDAIYLKCSENHKAKLRACSNYYHLSDSEFLRQMIDYGFETVKGKYDILRMK